MQNGLLNFPSSSVPLRRLRIFLQRRETAERIWPSYYNRVLYEHGAITERERGRMELKIKNYFPLPNELFLLGLTAGEIVILNSN